MEVEQIKKYIGKMVRVTLKNGFNYTFLMPEFDNSTISATTVMGESVDIDCGFIQFIGGANQPRHTASKAK